jgi:hypothetical protein
VQHDGEPSLRCCDTWQAPFDDADSCRQCGCTLEDHEVAALLRSLDPEAEAMRVRKREIARSVAEAVLAVT